MSTQAIKTCTHPPSRIFAWFANGVLCAGCCECGEILAGAAKPSRTQTTESSGGDRDVAALRGGVATLPYRGMMGKP